MADIHPEAPDATLLANIARLRQIEEMLASLRNTEGYPHGLLSTCHEHTSLYELISKTAAETPAGAFAKLALARDASLQSGGFTRLWHDVAAAALADAVRLWPGAAPESPVAQSVPAADAELVELWRRAWGTNYRSMRLVDEAEDLGSDHPDYEPKWGEARDLAVIYNDVVADMVKVRAESAVGIHAKARAVLLYLRNAGDSDNEPFIAISLARDIVGSDAALAIVGTGAVRELVA